MQRIDANLQRSDEEILHHAWMLVGVAVIFGIGSILFGMYSEPILPFLKNILTSTDYHTFLEFLPILVIYGIVLAVGAIIFLIVFKSRPENYIAWTQNRWEKARVAMQRVIDNEPG